jgi:hypothetical protein
MKMQTKKCQDENAIINAYVGTNLWKIQESVEIIEKEDYNHSQLLRPLKKRVSRTKRFNNY